MSKSKFMEAEMPLHKLLQARKSVKFVLFLHPYGDKLTSAWCFMPFAYGFIRQHFNCIFLDLPGFNKSTVASTSRCPPSRWAAYDVDIVNQVLEFLKIPRVHIVAMGEACEMFLNCLHKIPKSLARTHVLISPSLPEQALRTKYTEQFMSKLILSTSTTVLVMHDPKTYGNQANTIGKFRQSSTLRMFEQLKAQSALLYEQVLMAEIGAKDLQKVILAPSPDPGLADVCAVLPSRYFLLYLQEFLAGNKIGKFDSANLRWKLADLHKAQEMLKLAEEAKRTGNTDTLEAKMALGGTTTVIFLLLGDCHLTF